MSESQDIWILETGEYSDYRVLAAAADEATLTTFIEHLGPMGGDYSVSVIPLFAPGTLPHVQTTWIAHWSSHPVINSGTEIDVYSTTEIAELNEASHPPPKRPKVSVETDKQGEGYIRVEGASQEAVRKACADRVARWKAEAAGLTT